uniref:Bug family tripartite tricarboxylate transporter substrate binding protein n=1 Tax=Cupriavidus yeoncheonensis TaxID=1462994 RepID=UPI003F496A29
MAFRIKTHTTVGLLSMAVAIVAVNGPAHAEAWPTRPIQLIMASSAGTGTDAMGRYMAKRLSESLKQPVVVENRPGGSGVIGTNAVAKAVPDGYTLLYTTASNMVVSPAVIKTIQDPRKSLVPIAQTVVGGVMLLVSPDLPVRDLPDLIKFLKAHPGQYSFASSTVGSSAQLTMEWLKMQTGMKTEHVPYRSTSQLLTELSAGVIKMAWTDSSAPAAFLRSGKVRGIAISGNMRSPQFPDIKTMEEQGYKFDAVGWFGMFAPIGTDPAIVKRLSDEVNKIQTDPQLASMMKSMNFLPPPVKSTAQFREIIDNDMQTWAKIASDAGIKIDD